MQRFHRFFRIVLLLVIALTAIAFEARLHEQKPLTEVVLRFSNEADSSQLTSRSELRQRVLAEIGEEFRKLHVGEVQTRLLEEQLQMHHFIERCQVAVDVEGKLVIEVTEAQPLLRLMGPNGEAAFLSKSGRLFPRSLRYTPRVPVLVLPDAKSLTPAFWEESEQQKIIALFQDIQKDEFLSAQLADAKLTSKGKLIFYPQVGGEKIIFGEPVGFSKKFSKLKLYYNQVIPKKGWQSYETIDLSFDRQLVCN